MLFILFLLGCESAELREDVNLENSRSVVEIENDSTTPYFYPKHESFRKGDFDIKRFVIKEQENNYVLMIEMANKFRNQIDMPQHWDHKVFDIYLFTENGTHNMALNRRKAKFDTKWTKAILASPLRYEYLKNELEQHHRQVYDDSSSIEDLYYDVHVANRIEISGKKILISLPKEEFQEIIGNLTGVQVFVSNVESNDLQTSISEVKEAATLWSFGGGSYSKNHPNVISILGDNKQLKRFSDENTKIIYTTVSPVKVEQ